MHVCEALSVVVDFSYAWKSILFLCSEISISTIKPVLSGCLNTSAGHLTCAYMLLDLCVLQYLNQRWKIAREIQIFYCCEISNVAAQVGRPAFTLFFEKN